MAANELQDVVNEIAFGKLNEYARKLLWSGETSPAELHKTLDMFDFDKRQNCSNSGHINTGANENEETN